MLFATSSQSYRKHVTLSMRWSTESVLAGSASVRFFTKSSSTPRRSSDTPRSADMLVIWADMFYNTHKVGKLIHSVVISLVKMFSRWLFTNNYVSITFTMSKHGDLLKCDDLDTTGNTPHAVTTNHTFGLVSSNSETWLLVLLSL